MAAPIYCNFINGRDAASARGKTFENRNPADTNDLIGLFQDSGPEDARWAVAAATEAFRTWRNVPAPRRADVLFRAGRILSERKEQLAREMTREMGKVLEEARGDVQEAIDMAFFMAGEGRRLYGQTTPSELPDKFCMTVRMPLGVCALITPWNFPMAIPSWKIFPALVCGDTVVIKPASDTPLSCWNLVHILHEAGAPPGVVNLVTGSGSGVGQPLAADPDVRLVSFTGSTAVGRSVSETCAPAFKHCNLEMGGKNVIIILEDADLDLAVDGCLWGAFGTTGQRCTAASRIVVEEQVYNAFLERLAGRARSLRIGNGLDPSVQMGPVINEKQLHSVDEYVRIGQAEGARLVCGGHPLRGGPLACGWFYAPTVFADVDPRMRIAQEEIFGPVVSVIPCRGLDHAIEIGNGVAYGLSSSIYTRDVNAAFRAMREMYTGIFYVNAPTIGAEVHLPFGGTKDTGNGHRESGLAALDQFSEWKSIYVDYSNRLQRAQIDTE
jgi:aldehyde dehydrogenase (NAD+)